MDFYTETLENQRESTISEKDIAAFGLSVQGASHLEHDPPVPCQDAHGMRWLDREGIFIAAIADGVGSCALSHWGANTAVTTVLDSVQQSLEALAKGSPLTLTSQDAAFRKIMKDVMLEAFRSARKAVEQLAGSGDPPQPVFSFQSTLTLAIYDGSCLYHGHVGDDGIVVQLPDGTVEMATRRLKGEEANSVYPLQTGEDYWIFGVVPCPVAGFIMATDGVLDSFVASEPGRDLKSYFNGVCYSFMENAMYTLASHKRSAPQKALEEYRKFLLSPAYREKVNDDLTIIAAVSPNVLRAGKHPEFSIDEWKKTEEENRKARKKSLYGETQAPPQPPREDPPVKPPAEPRTAPADREPDKTPSADPRKQQALFFMKGILATLLVLVAFVGGITLGRTLLAPVKIQEHEDLQQSYSALLEEKEALTAELEAAQEQLTEKDEQIASLEDAIASCEKELNRLEKALDQARNESSLASKTAPGAAADETNTAETEPSETEELAEEETPEGESAE